MKKPSKKMKKIWIALGIVLAVIVVAAVSLFLYIRSESRADEISTERAQEIIDQTVSSMHAESKRKSVRYIADNTKVTVQDLEYGNEKNIKVTCLISTVDVYGTVHNHLEDLLNISTVDANGMQMTSTKLKLSIDPKLCTYLESAARVEKTAVLEIFQMQDGSYALYCTDDTVNAIFGGLADAKAEVDALKELTVNGEAMKVETNLRNGLLECLSFTYETVRPDNSVWIVQKWNDFVAKFRLNFIEGARWKYLTNGLLITMEITFFAVILGIVLGFVVAIIRCTHDKIGRLKFLNGICKIYLTIIRGTPVLVQLMIIYFVIFMPLNINKVVAAVLCFGLNSGAYVAEIVRGGIMSVDHGQFEAGRSLGFNYVQTMWHIVMPQAFKAVLPSLANEFIVLLKETSVASYIGINDLTRGGDIIRGVTFTAFLPLIAVALIYLVIVMVLTKLVSLLERRLRKSDRG